MALVGNNALRYRGAKAGYRLSIHFSKITEDPEKNTLGDYVELGPGAPILAAGSVSIGEDQGRQNQSGATKNQ